MQSPPQTRKPTCPRCQSEADPTRIYCGVCGFNFQSAINGNVLDQASPKDKMRFARSAVYSISALNFLLGIMEGFVENHSTAMTVNLVISLLVLALTPRTNESPISTLLFCIAINLGAQTIFPLMYIFPFDQWLALKILLIIIPVSALIILVTQKRNY